jgi:hypothetical protein
MTLRAYQVFAGMDAAQAEAFFGRMAERAPAVFSSALAAAGAALRMRPAFLRKQPLARQAAALRQALARVGSTGAAEEILAVYFLECRKELLVEWLDAVGVAHEEGTLRDEAPAEPGEAALGKAVAAFRSADSDPDRAILLAAFAAQQAIDWPKLEALL